MEQKYYKAIKSSLEKITEKKIKEIIYKINLEKKESLSKEQKTNHEENKNEVETTKESTEKETTKENHEQKINLGNSGLNPKYSFSSFIIGKANELACAACQAIIKNPGKSYNPLFIYGGVGLGKTHLLQAVGNEFIKMSKKVLYTTSEQFTNNYIDSIKSGRAKEFKNLLLGHF